LYSASGAASESRGGFLGAFAEPTREQRTHVDLPLSSTSSPWRRTGWVPTQVERRRARRPTTSVTSATGSLGFPSWYSNASEGGAWSWKISNLSNSSYTATPTLNWSAITRGVDVDAGALAVGGVVEKNVVPDTTGTLDTSLAWVPDPAGPTTIKLAVKDAAGTELQSTSGSSGTLSLPIFGVTGGATYKVAVTHVSGPAVRSFTRTATLPSQGSVKLELVDPDGAVKLVGMGRKPQALSGSVAPGSYTLRATPLSGVGSMTTTASFPGRVPSETTTFDGRDHAKTIDDGTTKVSDYLSSSGRVIRHVVAPSAGGAASEDTLFGYDDDGDTPAYSRATAGGAVTTYLDGAIDVAGTITYQHFNLHGDVIGTSNASGVFTEQKPADEFGLEEASSTTRLGWLGKQRRFEVGVNNLIRMGVRLYDPRTGRFTSVDPIEGGSANNYDYVSGDPINHFDLDGKFCMGFWYHCAHVNLGKALRKVAKYNWRRIDISASFCAIGCVAFGQQGGNLYVQRGGGLAVGAGLNVGVATRAYKRRACTSTTSAYGLYYVTASGKKRGYRDSEGGFTFGIGGGVSTLKSYDDRYCRDST
jgi:RHS repeat-associated protein